MASALSPVVFGGTPADVLKNAVALNQSAIKSPTSASRSDHFWASDTAPASSDIVEALEISFASGDITNFINFEASTFPCTISIEYLAKDAVSWVPVTDFYTKSAIVIPIDGSNPPVLPDPSTVQGHVHPQHDYEDHWSRYELVIAPIKIQKLRFLIQRVNNSNIPLSVTGSAVDYSVALQNIETGYTVSSQADIPLHLDEADSTTSGTVFANSADLFGSNLGFSKKTHRASGLLYNSDADASLIWKSEPQPVANAVVNFYADLRDAAGNARAIDRITIDPLYLGSPINLYYSNDTVGGQFTSSRRGLNASQASLNGAAVITPSRTLTLGFNGPDVGFVRPLGCVQFDNFYLGLDCSIPFEMGIEHQLDPLSDLDDNYVICDFGNIQVGLQNDGVNLYFYALVLDTQDLLTVPALFTSTNPLTTPYQLLFSSTGTSMRLAVQQTVATGDSLVPYAPVVTVNEMTLSVPTRPTMPSSIFLGSDRTLNSNLNGTVTAFVLRQAAHTDDSFLDFPAQYSSVPLLERDENYSRYNTLLRFDATQTSATNPSGFFGGPAFAYDQMNWTPIPRTYEMQRGTMRVPLTKAKFWNLEITGLRPETHEKYIPVTRPTKFFPPSLFQSVSTTTSATDRQSPDDFGTNVSSNVSNLNQFLDTPQFVGTGQTLSGIGNTDVYIAEDLQNQQRLAVFGSQWNWAQLHPDKANVRFHGTGTHDYLIVDTTQTSNLSYFAGLRRIEFARSLVTAPQDRLVYEEDFIDSISVKDGGTWTLTDTGLYSGAPIGDGRSYVRTTSVMFPSQTALRGLQYATVQSDAKLLDIDGQFSDPDYDPTNLSQWSPYGDGKLFGIAYNPDTSESALLVSRDSSTGYWADIPLVYGKTYGEVRNHSLYRTDTITITSGSATVSDPSVQASDNAAPVFGFGIPANAYVGPVTPGVGFQLTYSPFGVVNPALATASGTTTASFGHQTTYGDFHKGNAVSAPSGGVSSQTVAAPIGGRIHAAARVTSPESLAKPLFLQIVDSDTGGVLAESQSNVGANEVKRWYTSVNLADFGAKIGNRWRDLKGRTTYSSFTDTFNRPSGYITDKPMDSGQTWSTNTGSTSMSIQVGTPNYAHATVTGLTNFVDTQIPWGRLSVTIKTLPLPANHAASVPILDLGGIYVHNDSSFNDHNTSVPLGQLSPALQTGSPYNFYLMPTSVVPSAQSNGLDASAFPYSIVITNGNVGSETWLATYSTNHAFSSVKQIGGPAGIDFSNFGWTPGTAQFNVDNLIPLEGSTPTVLDTDGVNYTISNNGKTYITTGAYTWNAPANLSSGTTVSSLRADGTFLNQGAPSLSASASGSGSNFTAGTYYYKFLAFSAYGPTVLSSGTSVTVTAGQVVNLTWSAPVGTGSVYSYHVYRGTASGAEQYIGSSPTTSFTDNGFESDPLTTPASENPDGGNHTNGGGTMLVTDVKDNFGALQFNVKQIIASGYALDNQRIAWIDYNPSTSSLITLRASGKIINDATGNTIATIPSFTATNGAMTIRYANPTMLTPSFRSAWSINASDPQALIFIQNTTVVYAFSGSNLWTSTMRGIGGANVGTNSNQYTIIEGFAWSFDGNLLATNTSVTYGQVSYNHTRTYGQMRNDVTGSTRNLSLRLMQKEPSDDTWAIESATFFWDPIVWEFSCDNGKTWWLASDEVKNNPTGVMMFPYGLTQYSQLLWRLTSYAADMTVSHLAIRPWYSGLHGYSPPVPSQLPDGPNVVPTESYGPIERDPRWLGWDKPVPHWWWDDTISKV